MWGVGRRTELGPRSRVRAVRLPALHGHLAYKRCRIESDSSIRHGNSSKFRAITTRIIIAGTVLGWGVGLGGPSPPAGHLRGCLVRMKVLHRPSDRASVPSCVTT